MKVLDRVLKVWADIALFPLKLSSKRNDRGQVAEKLFITLSKYAERKSPVFISHVLRPKFYSDNQMMPNACIPSIAVILQGPVLKDNEFTLNTCRAYLQNNKNIIVILSTWKSEDESYLNKFREIGVIVIQSDTPQYGGYGNINYQLVSTKAGIACALTYNPQYICKTRTDQRIYGKYSLAMVADLIEKYPVTNNSKLTKRIACLATEYGSMYEPYYISDFFIFGTTQDMKLLLEIQFDRREYFDRTGLTRREIVNKKAIAEVYIHKSLASLIGGKYGESIKDYWNYLHDNIVLLDKSLIQLYWPKYDTRYCEHLRDGYYSTSQPDERNREANFTFSSWLCLINNQLEYDHRFEDYLDLPL